MRTVVSAKGFQIETRAIASQMFYQGFSAGQTAENRRVRKIRTRWKGLGVGIRQISA